MARRRRAVERASRRQAITDRVIAGLLAVVAASGLMSILPGQSQRAVARVACQVGSLGLGACTPVSLVLSPDRLTPPRCPILATLDTALPEVRVNRVTTSDGLAVETGTARSGDTYLSVGGPEDSEPPFLLDGEPRGGRTIAPGTQIPSRSAWFLPGGQGADAIVQAVHERYRDAAQRQSSLAVLSATLDRGGRDIPAPTIVWSRVRLDANVLPHLPTGPQPPRTNQLPTRTDSLLSTPSFVAVVPSRPAVVEFNRVSRESSVIADIQGLVGNEPVTGSVRWTRDADGTVTSVLLGLVSAGRLVPGEPSPPAGPSAGLTYIFVPVESATERAVVAAWLSAEGGFRLNLTELLGLRAPDADNQLTSFLTRAATVTVLRYAGLDAGGGSLQVRDELVQNRRVEAPEARLLSASSIVPQPARAPRVITTDPTCTVS